MMAPMRARGCQNGGCVPRIAFCTPVGRSGRSWSMDGGRPSRRPVRADRGDGIHDFASSSAGGDRAVLRRKWGRDSSQSPGVRRYPTLPLGGQIRIGRRVARTGSATGLGLAPRLRATEVANASSGPKTGFGRPAQGLFGQPHLVITQRRAVGCWPCPACWGCRSRCACGI